MTNTSISPAPYSDGPTGATNSVEGRRRGRYGRIIAAVVAVAALLVGIGMGRSSVSATPDARAVAASTAPAPTPSTVTRTVTSIVSSTTTADPITVTETPAPITKTPPAATVKLTVTESAAGPSASIPDGISLVGVDVQPGTYKSTAGDCYFARLSGTSNELDDIITNGNGATIVTIDPSDKAFESRYCGTWTKVE